MNSLPKLTTAAFCAVLTLVSVQAADIPLVNSGDTWRYHTGNNPLQTDWKTAPDASLTGSWSSGPGGFGYADSDDATVLSTMLNSYTTVRIRREFTIAAPVDTNLHLSLTMDWDDGFVAWLDGVELRRDRAPGGVGTEPATNAIATGSHEASGGGGAAPTTFGLGAVGTRLEPGPHVLALIGLNESLGSSDLSLIASLKLTEAPLPPLVSRSDTWRYRKGTNAPPPNWQTLPNASLDATWLSGPGGFGYADGDDATTLSDMLNGYVSVYIRRTFNVPSSIATNLNARLIVDYDDAYVAYLNGVEVARSANIVNGVVGVEPAFTNRANATHEPSGGGTGASAPVATDLGQAALLLPPGDHTLALIGFNENPGSSDFSLIADLTLTPAPTNGPCVQGTISTSTTWAAANSPITVCGNVTVASGATLTIEPGVTVLFDPGFGITVNGRLLAEGTPTNRIIFTRSGTSGTWSQIRFTANATTSVVAHAEMRYFAASALEANGTALHLDSIEWTNSTAQVVDVTSSSIVLLNSYIPGGAGNEPVHFSTFPASGHAVIRNCVFGAPQGYNDSIDFTGGNRPGPIVQFIDNVFLSGVDDCFDLDSTDAHIEGNIFLNVQQDDERESSSNPIATGEGSGFSEVVIARNIFFNCEHSLLLKDGGSSVMQNNTIVHLVTNVFARTAAPPGGQAIPPGIVMFGEPWRSGRTPGHGLIYEGNIAHDLHPLIQATPFPIYDPADSFLVASHSLIQGNTWPGFGNISSDPMFVNLAGPMTAQNIRSNLALLAGSPAIGTGPNGLDMGAIVPAGATITGAPAGTTTTTGATLKIAGPGIWSYRWRLNGGAWGTEVSLVPQSIWNGQQLSASMFSNAPPIVLSNLTDGTYTVDVIGRNSAGSWQDTNTAASVTWTVATTAPLRIDGASRAGNTVTLTFTAQAGLTYSVFSRDAFDGAHPWTKLADIPAQGATGLFQFMDPTATPDTRFYRIVTPAQP